MNNASLSAHDLSLEPESKSLLKSVLQVPSKITGFFKRSSEVPQGAFAPPDYPRPEYVVLPAKLLVAFQQFQSQQRASTYQITDQVSQIQQQVAQLRRQNQLLVDQARELKDSYIAQVKAQVVGFGAELKPKPAAPTPAVINQVSAAPSAPPASTSAPLAQVDAPKFSFGALAQPTLAPVSTNSEAPKFSFGAPAKETFNFGAPQVASQPAAPNASEKPAPTPQTQAHAAEPEKPKFSFGATAAAPANTTEPAAKPVFTFGAAGAETTAKPTFTFGPAPTTTATDASKPAFSFGQPPADGAQKPMFSFK